MQRDQIVVILLSVLVLVAVGTVLKVAQPVVLPLMIAWLLSYLLAPVIRVLTRAKVPNALAVIAVLVLLLAVCWVSGIFINQHVSAFTAEYPKYRARFTQISADTWKRWDLPANLFTNIGLDKKFGAFLIQLSGSLVSFLSNLVLVMIFLVFLLLEKPGFKYKIKRAVSARHAERVTKIMESVSGQISRYLATQLVMSLATGVLVWIALLAIGVDFPVTWGFLAFLLNFIPTIGSIVASVPPILLAFVQFYPRYLPAVECAAALLVIQMIMGNVISPKVMGSRLNLSPVVVLMFLLFWGWLWGIVGALLSMPLACTIKIVCENVEALHPIAVMMDAGDIYKKEAEQEALANRGKT